MPVIMMQFLKKNEASSKYQYGSKGFNTELQMHSKNRGH